MKLLTTLLLGSSVTAGKEKQQLITAGWQVI